MGDTPPHIENRQQADAEAGVALLEPRFLRILARLALQVQGRVRPERKGERRSVRRGAGGDFADTRPYAAGDDLRHLDWHLYGRLDQLLVRLYEEPQEHTVHVLLDTSRSMACGKDLFARRLAAAIAYLSLCSNDRVGVFAFGKNMERSLGPLRGKRAAHRVFRFLEGLAFQGETDIHRAIRGFVETRRRGTVVVISDFLTPKGRLDALRELARARVRGVVLHVMSPFERWPSLDEDLMLVDAETGAEVLVHIDERLRRAYLERLGLFTQELKDACRGYGFAFIETTSNQPLDELVLGDLRATGVVG